MTSEAGLKQILTSLETQLSDLAERQNLYLEQTQEDHQKEARGAERHLEHYLGLCCA